MEESLLDNAAQATSELQEALSTVSSEQQRDELILEHIINLSKSGTCVLDPNEAAEWVTGLAKKESLSSFCLGRCTLIDFFTYCCINCQHVLPDLKDLEDLYAGDEGFAVVGVHSAKFEAERVAQNVLHAAQRLGVSHPILNDPKAELWTRLGIHCWPTLLLLDPAGKPILVLAGEGHREILFQCVSVALKHFRVSGNLQKKFIPPTPSFTIPVLKNNLRFPGKIILNPFIKVAPKEPWITISDSGNNRILLADLENNIIHMIGGLDAGLKDGSLNEAKFNNPQGVCWLDSTSLIVCDTGNHVLRLINLQKKKVKTFAGTGQQGKYGDQGGLKFREQALASPWDIVLYKTLDMDLSVRLPASKKNDSDDKKKGKTDDELRRVILIACAGSHQIWALFLDTTIWWKYKTYAEGTLVAIVGSGREENRNNRYPNSAGLAQPSGLALCKDSLFIADSESSTVRKLDLSSGQLFPLVGGDRNPSNLFAYGDTDGTGYSARLQHPLAVACCSRTWKLYVADSYNNKIKHIDVATCNCTTLYPFDKNNANLTEPGGMCVMPTGICLYVADTNNDRIVCIDLINNEGTVLSLKFPKEDLPATIKSKSESRINITPSVMKNIKVCSSVGSKLILNINCIPKDGNSDIHLTPKAPQRWAIKILNSSLTSDAINEWDVIFTKEGKDLPAKFEANLKSNVGKNAERVICAELTISLCENHICFMKSVTSNCFLSMKPDYKKIAEYNMDFTVDSSRKVKCEIEEEDD